MPELSGMIQEFLEGNIKSIGGKTPVIQSKTITENGTYNTPSGVDGFNPVTVNVPAPLLEDRYINANGQYGPTEGYDGIRRLTVEVPVPSIVPLTINANGVYESTGGSGYNPITVNVPQNCEMYSSNDDKLRLYENVFNSLNVLVFNGLYINQTMPFNDIDNEHIKEVLNNLTFSSTPLARTYTDKTQSTSNSQIGVDLDMNMFRYYANNLAQFMSNNVYGSVVLIPSDLIANQYPIQVCPNIP